MTDVNLERELGWDDEIEQDGPEFLLLPNGDYDFEVISVEKSRYAGSKKEDGLPPCNMAVVRIRVDVPEGSTVVRHSLFLHSRTEGFLCEFFTCIGCRKKGEKVRMDWDGAVGRRGRAKIGIREYNGEKYNEIKKFYEPAEKKFEPGRF